MAVTMTDNVIQLALNALDSTFANGTLEIRSGAAPGADQAPTGTVLATITLPADPFAAASGRTKALNASIQDTSADSSGTAAHFRLVASGDGGGASESDPRIEGTVTGTGGGGDMELDNVVIAAAQTVTITAFNLTGAEA
jgi:hypothetical protein